MLETNPFAERSAEQSPNAAIPKPNSQPAMLLNTVSEYMATIGRKGGRIGGKRRLKTMTKEERRKAAAKAARARWGKRKS